MDFDGYAIGGVSVGEPEPEMLKAIELTEPFLPATKARYAMGLGTPAQMVELIARGVDMFDCVLPTRVARNGTAYTRKGAIGIKGGAYKADFRPIEEGCDCFACRNFTRAYLRHLLNVNEILGLRMMSVHNSHLFLKVMADVRAISPPASSRNFTANSSPVIRRREKFWPREKKKRKDDFGRISRRNTNPSLSERRTAIGAASGVRPSAAKPLRRVFLPAKTLALHFGLWHYIVTVRTIFANLWENRKSLPI